MNDNGRKALEDIAVGDRVWVSSGHGNDRDRIQPVARLTPTQIILDGHYSGGVKSEFNRYRRGKLNHWGEPTYRQISGGMWRSEITSIATPTECSAWDEKQAKERAETEAKRRISDQREALRLRLVALFPTSSAECDLRWISQERDGNWTVNITLPEERLRSLADWLRNPT